MREAEICAQENKGEGVVEEGKRERENEQNKCDITEVPKNIETLERVGTVLIKTDVEVLTKEKETKEPVAMRCEEKGKDYRTTAEAIIVFIN